VVALNLNKQKNTSNSLELVEVFEDASGKKRFENWWRAVVVEVWCKRLNQLVAGPRAC